ncbi:MAG: GntR family transcriptional regulator [Candidatus Omnitrophica bacterium]|nr:GntR family transcriptional regulator [Candidatus Omnitrophota bacterium]
MKIKYIAIQDYIQKLIEKGKHGDILPSEKELSKKFNVSHMTVRRVYEYFEKEGRVYRKKGKGTFIRKINFRKDDLHFSFLIPHYMDYQKNPFYIEIFKGILEKASLFNIKLHLFNFTEDYFSILKELERNKCDVIISFIPEKRHYKFLEELSDRGYIVFAINRIIKNYNINYISADHVNDAYKLTKNLIERNKRKVGFIGLWEGHEFSRYRFEGYKKALQEEKIKINNNLVIHLPFLFPIEILIPEKTIELIIKRNIDAIICTGGSFLPYILKGIKDIGAKIPDDIEIATFDKVQEDIEEKEVIHEVIQPLKKIGELTIENALKVLKGEKGKIEILIPSEIVMKEFETVKI